MPKYDINVEKTYNIPQTINQRYYNDKILVISPLTANWIVLQTKNQLNIFDDFRKGKSIKEVLVSSLYNSEDVVQVVTQIEARKFCNKVVNKSTENGKSMHLYLTNKCNLQCPHCYMFSGNENDNELSTEEIINLMRDYKSIAHGRRITLSGGEPSARIDFVQIIKEAYNIGLEIKILTNGLLMTSERIADIAQYLTSVQISIDGYSEESNATIRGVGHFQKALNAVEVFISYGVETSIAITPSWNLLKSSMVEYIKFAKDMIAKYKGKPFEVKFSEGLSLGRAINPSDELNDNYATLMKSIQKEVYGEHFELVTFVEKMESNTIMDNCLFGVFSVSSTGDVYLCPEIGSLMPIANIRTTPFKEICNQAYIAERATCISMLSPCNKCELMYICGGGCRVKAFPDLVKRTSFSNLNYEEISPRVCSSVIKEKFYKMMIESNEYLYSTLEEDTDEN